MNNFNQMPPAPMPNYQYGVDSFGNPITIETYNPQPQMMQYQQYYQQPSVPQQPVYQQVVEPQMVPNNTNLGINLNGLIGTNASVPVSISNPVDKQKRKKKATTKIEEDGTTTTELVPITAKEANMVMVEEVSYSDTYDDTTRMLKGAIAQADELASDIKVELNKIRAINNMKGKYTYIANLSAALSGLIGTKVGAIREINSSIRSANDAEYRRYKDIASAAAKETKEQDLNKFISETYNAYIHAPVGSLPNAQQYYQPTAYEITANGYNGINKVDSAPMEIRDAGFGNYMANLTPEQNLMIHEGNPNIEEVIIYDQATGKKYFQWINLITQEPIYNMPSTPMTLMEDYTIDPRTRIAKNINLNSSMKVIYKNEGILNEY